MLSVLITNSSAAAAENRASRRVDDDFCVENASLQPSSAANCTKIKIFLSNSTDVPIGVLGVKMDKTRYLDMITFEETKAGLPEGLLGKDGQGGAAEPPKDPFYHAPGSLQWHRVLPNPVEPHSVSEMIISLWGVIPQAALNIKLSDGSSIPLSLHASAPALRLSSIAFAPDAPSRIYVYCENKGIVDVTIARLTVNMLPVEIIESIPSARRIGRGGKICLIADVTPPLDWGSYAAIGVEGEGGEEAFSLARVMNVFMIGSWDGDTRAELNFESIPFLRSWSPLLAEQATADDLEQRRFTGSQAWFLLPGRQKTTETQLKTLPWIADRMDHIYKSGDMTPCAAVAPAYGIEVVPQFGGLSDALLVEIFALRLDGAGRGGLSIRETREFNDPRPVIGMSEAHYRNNDRVFNRAISPQELTYNVWDMIAEGSRGICHFIRMDKGDTRGYGGIPELEQAIGRVNLDLQLLKPFLRIGDSFGAADSDNPAIRCKLLLCADQGLVLIAINENFDIHQNKLDSPVNWPPTGPAVLSVDFPAGKSIRRAFEVNGGFRPVPLKISETKAAISIKELEIVSVFLLPFEADEPPEASSLSADSWDEAQRTEVLRQLLDSENALPPAKVLMIGKNLLPDIREPMHPDQRMQ